MRAYVFLITGFEEIEAITVIDVLRRGGVDCTTISLTGEREVKGGRGVPVICDLTLDGLDYSKDDMLILPGGAGTENYMKHEIFLELLKMHYADGGHIGAICAAPTVLGQLGLLRDKQAVCYPSPMLLGLLDAKEVPELGTVTDGNITTSRGVATALDFALELMRIVHGDLTTAAKVAEGMLMV
jgi:4-methyl-5(b-hydroxyethyl)-thiazole monophosphate biosynthesis